MAEHNDLGRWGEDAAAHYLEREGYQIVARNWKDGHRDIDIVAYRDGVLVIVEVKTRRNNMFTEPELAVDWRKIRSLSMAASKFVKLRRIDADIRFDIIGITGTSDDDCQVNHIEDAFLPVRY